MNLMHFILAQRGETQQVEQQFELARWSAGNALLVGGILTVVGLYAVIWMYRREARGRVSKGLRWAMVLSRIGVLLLLGLIGLEPVIVKLVHRKIQASTVVLVDESASMGLVDAYRKADDAARMKSVATPHSENGWKRSDVESSVLLAKQEQFLRELSSRNLVKLYSFGNKASLRETISHQDISSSQSAVDAAWLKKADAPATNLGTAVRGAVDALAGTPISGIVVLSDGNFNQGEPVETIGRMLKQKGISLHSIGIGDPSPPINVSVAEVNGPRYAFKNDPFNVSIRVAAEGLTDEDVTVELLEKSGGENEFKSVGTRVIRAESGGKLPPISFERKISKPGSISYAARVSPVPFESVATDNQREMVPAMQILDDKMAVLIVSGAPSYDYRFLTRMLERDSGVELSTWLQSADVQAVREGTRVITELPSTPEDLYKYDAILLLDADPNEFDPTWASMVASFVSDHGGGLLVQAGNKYTGKFMRSPKAAPIMEILPVVPDPDAEILVNELGQYQTRAWPLVIPEQAIGDPILRLSDNAMENRSIWSGMEGVYWGFPVRREKPVANVLMRNSDPRMVNSYGPQALLATQFVGAGRTAWLGFNSTWRWRRFDEKLFNRLWVQLLRYLVEGRLTGGGSRGQILTQSDQFFVGDTISLTVRALDERFEPLNVAELEVQVDPGQGGDTPKKYAASAITGRDGYYQAIIPADQPGLLRLSVDLPGRAGKLPQANKLMREISVTLPDVEMRNTALNKDAMRTLATLTNGKYFEVDEASQVPQLIQDSSQTIITRERPLPLWDNGRVFGVLLALLSLEWILRKKARLL